MSDEKFPILHIYGQPTWHQEAEIVGNREALEILQRAVAKALSSGRGHAEVFVNDGEGYRLEIQCLTLEQAMAREVPYFDLP